jgi:hypothetical protein
MNLCSKTKQKINLCLNGKHRWTLLGWSDLADPAEAVFSKLSMDRLLSGTGTVNGTVVLLEPTQPKAPNPGQPSRNVTNHANQRHLLPLARPPFGPGGFASFYGDCLYALDSA